MEASDCHFSIPYSTMFMNISRSFGALVAVVAVSAAFAVEVTPEQAQKAAQNWVRRSPRQMTAQFASGDVRQARTSKAGDGKALYHVVEVDGGGYVVTSGDTELPPVIAFSSSGTLDLSDQRNPLVVLLERDLANRKSQLAKPRTTLLSTPQPGAGGTSATGASFEDEWAELLDEPEAAPAGGMTLMGAFNSISDTIK